jgi:hypothetical protein
MDDSAETIQPAYGKAFDLVGVKGLGPGTQGAAAASDRWVRCWL